MTEHHDRLTPGAVAGIRVRYEAALAAPFGHEDLDFLMDLMQTYVPRFLVTVETLERENAALRGELQRPLPGLEDAR